MISRSNHPAVLQLSFMISTFHKPATTPFVLGGFKLESQERVRSVQSLFDFLGAGSGSNDEPDVTSLLRKGFEDVARLRHDKNISHTRDSQGLCFPRYFHKTASAGNGQHHYTGGRAFLVLQLDRFTQSISNHSLGVIESQTIRMRSGTDASDSSCADLNYP